MPGSFHVSTAHELRFADGARFSALDKTGSGLTVAPPEAFGFLDKPPGRIAVDRSQLQLTPGKTLSLVGGDIDIAGRDGWDSVTFGHFRSYDDRIHPGVMVNLVSLASPGYARISDAHVEAAAQGTIRLNHSSMSLSGNGGGKFRIRSGAFFTENADIYAGNTGEANSK